MGMGIAGVLAYRSFLLWWNIPTMITTLTEALYQYCRYWQRRIWEIKNARTANLLSMLQFHNQAAGMIRSINICNYLYHQEPQKSPYWICCPKGRLHIPKRQTERKALECRSSPKVSVAPGTCCTEEIKPPVKSLYINIHSDSESNSILCSPSTGCLGDSFRLGMV